MEYPNNDRTVMLKLKDSRRLVRARFRSDAAMAHWLKTEGRPESNAFVALDAVEDWFELPLEDTAMPDLSMLGANPVDIGQNLNRELPMPYRANDQPKVMGPFLKGTFDLN